MLEFLVKIHLENHDSEKHQISGDMILKDGVDRSHVGKAKALTRAGGKVRFPLLVATTKDMVFVLRFQFPFLHGPNLYTNAMQRGPPETPERLFGVYVFILLSLEYNRFSSHQPHVGPLRQ